MFAWRYAAGFALLAAGCQGEYPIAPTVCDEWCDVSQGLTCGFYDPAACVSECEGHFHGSGACRAPLGVALACFRDTPGALATYCSFGFQTPPCPTELDALYSCVQALPQSGWR